MREHADEGSVTSGCGYVCKYTPIAVLAGFGVESTRLSPHIGDPTRGEALTHPNLCSYCKAIICSTQRHDVDELLLTSCCDSMRRTADAIDGYGELSYLRILDLPHCDSACAVERYTMQIKHVFEDYSQRTGRTFDLGAAVASVGVAPAQPTGPYLAIVGARMEGDLYRRICDRSPLPVRDLTCVGCEGVGPVPPEERTDVDAFLSWYAGALLAQPGCMRMSVPDDRRTLALDPHLAGVIYHGLKFCDFYSYDFTQLASQLIVPITRLETDWNDQGSGQLATRVDALIESLDLTHAEGNLTMFGPSSSAPRPSEAPGSSSGDPVPHAHHFAGIDSGSTSTDVVIVDETGDVVAHVVRSTGAHALESARSALDDALAQAALAPHDLAYTIATGYGRDGIGIGDAEVTEITCHARGAHEVAPACRTVIDIGGQDSKAIRLGPDGSVRGFAMNDKCAAGTGRFLEAMARTLELSVDELARMGTTWEEDIALSTMCTVFAESEVVSLIAQNKRTSDIVHGIDKSVAVKTAALVSRVGEEPVYLITGGVAQNAGVVAALSARLGSTVQVPSDPQVCGALGAALIARDRMVVRKDTCE